MNGDMLFLMAFNLVPSVTAVLLAALAIVAPLQVLAMIVTLLLAPVLFPL